MSIQIILLLVLFHFIADFLLQNDWMGLGKSKKLLPLFIHSLVYSGAMTLFLCGMSFGLFMFGAFDFLVPIYFFIIMFVSHFVIDFISSRVNKYLYENNEIRIFFNVIGFDQYLHYLVLFLSINFLFY